jgi:hypothetical protein
LRGKGKEKSNLDRKGKTLKREKEGRDRLPRKEIKKGRSRVTAFFLCQGRKERERERVRMGMRKTRGNLVFLIISLPGPANGCASVLQKSINNKN